MDKNISWKTYSQASDGKYRMDFFCVCRADRIGYSSFRSLVVINLYTFDVLGIKRRTCKHFKWEIQWMDEREMDRKKQIIIFKTIHLNPAFSPFIYLKSNIGPRPSSYFIAQRIVFPWIFNANFFFIVVSLLSFLNRITSSHR